MQNNKDVKINQEFIDELYKSALSIVYNELKSHWLLGDTNEFDEFEPETVVLDNASAYDIYRRACCEYVGYKIDENERDAEKHWLKASEMNEPNAILEYSVCLFEQLKYEEGFKCLQKASKLGSPVAIFRVALCYLNGIGCKEDSNKGTSLIKLLASKDDANALYFYSTMLEYGNGAEIQVDKKGAEEALNKALKLGSAFAKTDVGLKAYMKAKTSEEKVKSLQLVEEGAGDGDIRAMCIMAIIYAKGEDGIEQNIEKSHKYLALSYDAGFPIAVKIVEEAKKFIKKASNNN
ncbi:MAG: sel1 repeat family protein [Clostridia bacterium]|nr:sel1 repeat family protein [Clostridia bacterium]